MRVESEGDWGYSFGTEDGVLFLFMCVYSVAGHLSYDFNIYINLYLGRGWRFLHRKLDGLDGRDDLGRSISPWSSNQLPESLPESPSSMYTRKPNPHHLDLFVHTVSGT